jgi:hypothetical protein
MPARDTHAVEAYGSTICFTVQRPRFESLSRGQSIQQNKEYADDTLVGLMEGLLKPPQERLSDSAACEKLGIPSQYELI